MHRLPLILCAIALLGSAMSGALYFRIGNSKQVLEQRLVDARTRATKLDADLAAANEQNGSLKSKLSALEGELDSTKGNLAVANTQTAQLTRDLADTKSVLSVYEATTRALGDEVAA